MKTRYLAAIGMDQASKNEGGRSFKPLIQEKLTGEMTYYKLVFTLMFALMLPAVSIGAENLVLNPHLDYKKNNHQGPLITGDKMLESTKPGMPNFIVFYAEFCYNAKRQARTTVDLYNQYRDRVHFVVIDFEYGWSTAQNKLVEKYFARHIPQVVILDSTGRPVFNYIGEAPEETLQKWLNAVLQYPDQLAEQSHPMDKPIEIVDTTSSRFDPVTKILKKF